MEFEAIILYVLLWSLGIVALYVFYTLMGERVYKKKYKTVLGINANLNKQIRDNRQETVPVSQETGDLKIASLAALPDKDMMELLGIDAKAYRLAKPFIGKILSRLGGGGEGQQVNQGATH